MTSLLRVLDERVQGLAQRRKPEAEVDELGVLQSDLLLVVRDFAVQVRASSSR